MIFGVEKLLFQQHNVCIFKVNQLERTGSLSVIASKGFKIFHSKWRSMITVPLTFYIIL